MQRVVVLQKKRKIYVMHTIDPNIVTRRKIEVLLLLLLLLQITYPNIFKFFYDKDSFLRDKGSINNKNEIRGLRIFPPTLFFQVSTRLAFQNTYGIIIIIQR